MKSRDNRIDPSEEDKNLSVLAQSPTESKTCDKDSCVRRLIWKSRQEAGERDRESEGWRKHHYECDTEVSAVGNLGSVPVGTF